MSPFKLIAIFILGLALFSCSPFGESGLLRSPKLGKPTMWLVHGEIDGRVVDCSYSSPVVEGDFKKYRAADCIPVPNAAIKIEIAESLAQYWKEGFEYEFDCESDEQGGFRFSKRSSFRLYGWSDQKSNALSYGHITVSAPGYATVESRLHTDDDPVKAVVYTPSGKLKAGQKQMVVFIGHQDISFYSPAPGKE